MFTSITINSKKRKIIFGSILSVIAFLALLTILSIASHGSILPFLGSAFLSALPLAAAMPILIITSMVSIFVAGLLFIEGLIDVESKSPDSFNYNKLQNQSETEIRGKLAKNSLNDQLVPIENMRSKLIREQEIRQKKADELNRKHDEYKAAIERAKKRREGFLLKNKSNDEVQNLILEMEMNTGNALLSSDNYGELIKFIINQGITDSEVALKLIKQMNESFIKIESLFTDTRLSKLTPN